jgi:hypothetical protein
VQIEQLALVRSPDRPFAIRRPLHHNAAHE